jgi:gas vesicle protein
MSDETTNPSAAMPSKYAAAALIIAALTGGGVGSTVSLVSAPDLELAKRDAVDTALERMRAEVDREIAPMRGRLERIEEKLDRLIERAQ